VATDLDMFTPFTVTVSVQGKAAAVRLAGELDAGTAAALAGPLADALAGGPARLVFDLAGLDFLDCAGARALARAGRHLPPGQRPVLRGPGPIVLRLLQLTGLDRQFTIEPAGPGPARPGPRADVTELATGEHDRIGRLFAALEDTARRRGPR
jgi:anti-anti-sigma factor